MSRDSLAKTFPTPSFENVTHLKKVTLYICKMSHLVLTVESGVRPVNSASKAMKEEFKM